MQQMRNQLNKVKYSTKECNIKEYDFEPEAVCNILNAISDDVGNLKSKTVAVFNSKSAILPIGLKYFSPGYIVVITENYKSGEFMKNYVQFAEYSDIISAPIFKLDAFDVEILAPKFQEINSINIKNILENIKKVRTAYLVCKSDHHKTIYSQFPKANIVCKFSAVLPISLNYQSKKIDLTNFHIYKLK